MMVAALYKKMILARTKNMRNNGDINDIAFSRLLKGALILLSLLFSQNTGGAGLAEALKGNVEETGVAPAEPTFNPAVPMAVPVMKKKMSGSASDSALKRPGRTTMAPAISKACPVKPTTLDRFRARPMMMVLL